MTKGLKAKVCPEGSALWLCQAELAQGTQFVLDDLGMSFSTGHFASLWDGQLKLLNPGEGLTHQGQIAGLTDFGQGLIKGGRKDGS